MNYLNVVNILTTFKLFKFTNQIFKILQLVIIYIYITAQHCINDMFKSKFIIIMHKIYIFLFFSLMKNFIFYSQNSPIFYYQLTI